VKAGATIEAMQTHEVEACLMHQLGSPELCPGRTVNEAGAATICRSGWTEADEVARVAALSPVPEQAEMQAATLGMASLAFG